MMQSIKVHLKQYISHDQNTVSHIVECMVCGFTTWISWCVCLKHTKEIFGDRNSRNLLPSLTTNIETAYFNPSQTVYRYFRMSKKNLFDSSNWGIQRKHIYQVSKGTKLHTSKLECCTYLSCITHKYWVTVYWLNNLFLIVS